jgi:NADH-quinone oxidoreductase subunit J
MLIFGIGVVANRNPVSSAMCLVVSFIGLAAVFITLNAYFIGVVQILVYAGAVMVLFLFIIMLLDIRAEKRRSLNYYAIAGGIMVVVAFVIQLLTVVSGFKQGNEPMPELATKSIEDVKSVGFAIFTNFNFHLQVMGVLLLVATIGVVVLSRRQHKS